MAPQNPIRRENKRPGTREWLLERPVSCRDRDWTAPAETAPDTPVRRTCIEGYGTRMTVNKGEWIGFCVSSRFRWFAVAIYRMGWYGSDGARRMPDLLRDPERREVGSIFPGTYQPAVTDAEHCVRCAWSVSCWLKVPADPEDWVSGVYLAKLSGFDDPALPLEGEQSYMIFVVRDDQRPSEILAQLSTTTWHAYNRWGGFSAYSVQPAYQVCAQRLSFDRPFQSPDYAEGRFGSGAGLFLNNFTSKLSPHTPQAGFGNGRFGGWELSSIRWLEREGYDLTYCTNTDIHDRADLFRGHRCLLSLGHDEYWSAEMFDRVLEAVDEGALNVGFFSGNTMFRVIELSGDRDGTESRTMASYAWATPNEWTEFNQAAAPGYRDTRRLIGTTLWKSSDDIDQDLTLLLYPRLASGPAGWILEGTRLAAWNQGSDGSWPFVSLGLLLGGHEVNVESPAAMLPDTTPVIGVLSADVPSGAGKQGAEGPVGQWLVVGVWKEAPQARIFSAGTVLWGWALDDFAIPGHELAVTHPPRRVYLSADVQTITRNVLARLLAPVFGLPTGT